MEYAKEIMETATYFKEEIAKIPDLFVLGTRNLSFPPSFPFPPSLELWKRQRWLPDLFVLGPSPFPFN